MLHFFRVSRTFIKLGKVYKVSYRDLGTLDFGKVNTFEELNLRKMQGLRNLALNNRITSHYPQKNYE